MKSLIKTGKSSLISLMLSLGFLSFSVSVKADFLPDQNYYLPGNDGFIVTNQNDISNSVKIASRERYVYYHFRKSDIAIDLQTKVFCQYIHFVVDPENPNEEGTVNVLNKGVLVSKNNGFISNTASYNIKKSNPYVIKNNLKEAIDISYYKDKISLNKNELEKDLLVQCTKAGGFQRTYKTIVTPSPN